ncbi:flagellar biosynthesis protein FliO [Rhodopseudomonas sp. AAP120]|uniref:flagellar biosynthetic protein FliO n=1 Tax=Rhodopseudomonas sp. AAP120 TaxID=1523430 RepID=UPI0006B9AFE5|nr:flagellar biosynthetic protein FliO [Rhodopseudomonas sp. AAP120]KPF98913.1 flagellar biosynthesis protein FliO [Rhodopseudomonas sp. AAP120]
MQQPLMFFFAFLAVLAMIGAAAWLVRRFAGNRLGTHTKSGRMPRLAVIDAAAVDGRRRLVLVRRDNVEHLLMIGGPSDIVIETSIVRANPAREASRPGPSVEPRLGPADWEADGAQEAPEPVLPDLPPRPARPSFADEPRRPGPAPMPPRRTSEFPPSDPFAGLVPEPIVRPELPPIGRPEPRPEPRAEARPEPRIEPSPRPRQDPVMPRAPRPELPKAPVRSERPIPPIAPPAAPPLPSTPAPAAPPAAAGPSSAAALSAADQNLAEMANRLEAALRRPPDAKPEAAAPEPARPAPRAPEPRPEPPAASAPATKSGFESLEDEMASLLGRPKTPS